MHERRRQLIAAKAPLLLVAHGSRDPRAAVATEALAVRVRAAAPGVRVAVSYLDHTAPDPVVALAAFGDGREPIVVPLLFTPAYHASVDLPTVLASTPCAVASVLAPDPLLIAALARRVRAAGPADALVLAAAGSADGDAVALVGRLASQLAVTTGIPTVPAFASAAAPDPATAVAALRAEGHRRVVMSSLFLAPGLLYDRAVSAALGAGAAAVCEPLLAAPELVALVLNRYRTAAKLSHVVPWPRTDQRASSVGR